LRDTSSNGLTALSLCTGAGGLDLGVEAAGFRVVGQVEIDADSVGTLRAHQRLTGTDARVVHAGIEDVDPRHLREELGLARGELSLLAGGPPCQPFTTHGRRQGIRDGRVSSLFPSYLRYIREFAPATFLMENVDGLLSAAIVHRPLSERTKDRPMGPEEMKGSFLRWLVGELCALGYTVCWGILEASDFGVPQMRQRAFLLGTKSSAPCYLPEGNRDAPRTTLREALSGIHDPGPVQPLSAAKVAVYSRVPAGGNWRSLPVEVQEATMGRAFLATGGKSGWWRRLSWDEPAPTVLGMPDHSSTGLIHPDEVRCLGLRECAAVQTFPADYPFAGRPRSQYQQVGNAVPVKLAQVVAERVRGHLGGERFAQPVSPPWRKESSNRRIGTHGWVERDGRDLVATLNVKVRDDHVWSREGSEGRAVCVSA
jgi:DNA (cytosine-5)-methyltransferase 1